MKITTTCRYGLRAAIDLATHQNEGFISLADISQRQGLSLNYLEHAFAALKKAGFLQGQTGAAGGYRLTRSADRITAAELIAALEGKTRIVTSVSQTPISQFLQRALWSKVDAEIERLAAGITLEELAVRYREKLKHVES